MKKSTIIPAYNEEDGIKGTIDACKKVLNRGDEIIVVSDGSTDKTVEIAKKTGVRVLDYKKNKGKAGALKTGFKAAKNE